MRINEITLHSLNSSSSTPSIENPFDLDLKITDLQIGYQGKAPMITSFTVGYCDNTGTGRSMCCNSMHCR